MPDIDILGFRDRKGNNLLHCSLKDFIRDYTEKLYEYDRLKKYVPGNLSEDQVKEKLKVLVQTNNNIGFNPLEQALVSQNHY